MFSALILAVRQVVNFRVLVAMTTSATVTASVAGPMAYQANRVQDALAAEVAAPLEVPAPSSDPETGEPTTPTTTSSTTSTSTTSTTSTTTTTSSATTPPTTSPQAQPSGPVPTIGTTPTIPGTPPVTAEGLSVSLTPNVAQGVALSGAKLFEDVYIFYAGDAQRVTYWIDDPDRSGPSLSVSKDAPFFVGGGTFDVGELSEGSHELTAVIKTETATLIRSATFTVTYG